MRKIHFLALACSLLSATFLPSALANHRTGSLPTPELLVAGDFNGDGNMDLAVNGTGFDVVAILLGDGKGGMTLKGHLPVDTLVKGLDIGNVNRDGHPDLVAATNWGYDEIVLLGDGVGSFHVSSPPSEIDGDGEPVRVLLRDFNNDGALDIFVNAPDDNSCILYFGDGKGNFPGPDFEIEDVQQPYGMDAGDLNGDGNLDAVVGGLSKTVGESKLSVLLGDGEGGFTVSSFTVNDNPASTKIGDFNHDGHPDVIVAGAVPGNKSGNFISTYLGDGQGGFALAQTLDLGKGNLKGEIAIGDFNEDGNLDVAFPVTGTQIQHDHSTIIDLFFGDGHGQLSAGPVLTVGAEPHTVIAVDVNHDGHLDLANTNRTDGTVTVQLGDGQGNFTVS